ncbi:MAG: helicase-exonuclease AddAB subunit AddB, partial [Firmicutes bacterium]|nr:helicase-exonuclease AddAB subunit AddB [Bacillota bacterium]
MFLNIITGRAGTGKTTRCLREIRQELERKPLGDPLILLVPEQASFQTERALTGATAAGGYMRAQVLGFRRLAHRVLQEAGGAVKVPLGETGKRMVLRRLLENRRAELRILQRAADMPGFVDQLAGVLGEMKTYRVGPEDLGRCRDRLRGSGRGAALINKLHDLQMIFADLETFIRDRFTDPDDYLTLAAEKIGSCRWLASARVWVDGFTGYTPREYAVLSALIRHTAGVSVALCLPPDLTGKALPETDPFYPVWETCNTLVELAAR